MEKISVRTLLNLGFERERDGGFEYLTSPLTELGYLVTQDVESIDDLDEDEDSMIVTPLSLSQDFTYSMTLKQIVDLLS